MKKRLFSFFLCFLLTSGVHSQSTISIRLSTATGEGAYVSNFYPVGNFPGYSDLTGVAWTDLGTPYMGRSYFKYDLSAIPVNAVVTSAYLSLYANPTPTQPSHSTLSGANNALIQMVTGPWDDNSITWNTRPATTATGEVPLAASFSPLDDYLNINVTHLVYQMVNNPATNYGFMLRLQTELHYRSLNFASISCADTSKQPLLVITYSTNLTCVDLKLDATTGEGAYVSNFYPVGNFPGYSDLVGVAWTDLGTPYVGRSYFKYNLSAIPVNAIVASAYLSVYANPTPTQPAHSTLSGANGALIQKVTGAWDANTLTWTNKPGTTSTGEIPLSPSTSANDNFLSLNVTQHIAQMVSNPSTNYGFMLRLQTELHYRSLNFASVTCTDTTRKTSLVVCYSVATPLPVTMIDFNGKCSGTKNKIEWTTSSEINNDYFNVLRRSSLTDYEIIHTQGGNGNSNSNIHYEYTDLNPLPGINYYKLLQSDFDGVTTEFGPIKVESCRNIDQFSFSTVTDLSGQIEIIVNLPSKCDLDIQLYTSNGKLIFKKHQIINESGSHKLEINHPEFHQGIYLLKISNGTNADVAKLVRINRY